MTLKTVFNVEGWFSEGQLCKAIEQYVLKDRLSM